LEHHDDSMLVTGVDMTYDAPREGHLLQVCDQIFDASTNATGATVHY